MGVPRLKKLTRCSSGTCRDARGVGTNQLTPRGAKVATRNAKAERDRTGSLIPEPGTTDVHQLVKRLIEGM